MCIRDREKFYALGTPICRLEAVVGEKMAQHGTEGSTTMEKIQMTTPLVEMDGDEMTRILWKQIKDELLLPYVDLKTEYYDLGLRCV